MMRTTIGRVKNHQRFPFVSTLDSVFGALASVMTGDSLSARDRLELRAANDAEQR